MLHEYTQVSEDNLQESVLSFHHVGPGAWTHIIRFGSFTHCTMYPAWFLKLSTSAACVQMIDSLIYCAILIAMFVFRSQMEN